MRKSRKGLKGWPRIKKAKAGALKVERTEELLDNELIEERRRNFK